MHVFLHLEMLKKIQRENRIYSSSDPQHQTEQKKKENVFSLINLYFLFSLYFQEKGNHFSFTRVKYSLLEEAEYLRANYRKLKLFTK